jgi:hypothetical protein
VIWFIEVSSRFFGLTPTGSQSSQGSPAGTGSCGSGTAFGSVTWCWITLLPHDGSLVLTQILHYFHVFESSRGTPTGIAAQDYVFRMPFRHIIRLTISFASVKAVNQEGDEKLWRWRWKVSFKPLSRPLNISHCSFSILHRLNIGHISC